MDKCKNMVSYDLDPAILDPDLTECYGNELFDVFDAMRQYMTAEDFTETNSALERLVGYYSEGYQDQKILNDVILHIADCTPYSSPIHRKLAQMVLDFQNNDSRKAKSKTLERPEYDMFRGQLQEDITDHRVSPLGAVQSGFDTHECANFEAFLANLMHVGFSHNVKLFLQYAMQDAFYEDHTADTQAEPSKAQAMLDAWIITAAQWIYHSSEEALAIARKGDDGYSMADWVKWQQEFQKAANDRRYGEECRKVASQGADLMALAEKAGG